MKKLKSAPSPLRRKFYMTGLLGLLCLLVGISVYFFSKDKTMLLLSGVVCILSLWRAYSIFRIVVGKQYETVEGTCVSITPKPLRKYRRIRIMDDEGNESYVLLNKQSKVKIGYRYRFFFKQTQRLTFGSEYLDAAMSSDHFLGYEELGEFAGKTTE
ncbi:MAG: hypothetical protein HFE65_01540 [Clostridiales bacterium]|nr:hypothetical protein [Clostridiales bacterium]